MRFEEKLRKQMLLKGLNQQRLAKLSAVSDSEISRILSGKSGNPGIENSLKLARAIGVSLDYLADDNLDDDTLPATQTAGEPTGVEVDILDSVRELGAKQARRILETVSEMGYEIAMRRLLEMKPVIEVGDPPRSIAQPMIKVSRRASSA